MAQRQIDPAKLFLASTAVMAAGTSAYWVIFGVRIVQDLQLEPHQLALLGTALEGGVLLSEVPTGVIADVISRRTSIILAFLVMGPAMAMAGVFEAFWLVALTQLAWGVGWTMQSGADVAWLTDELRDPDRVDRLILAKTKVEVAANSFGVPVALALNLLLTRTQAIAISSMTLFVWGLVLMAIMPETGFVRRPGQASAEFKRVLVLGGRLTIRTPSLRILAVSLFLGGVAGEAADRLDVARLFEVGLPKNYDEVVFFGLLVFAQGLVSLALLRLVERRFMSFHAARVMGVLNLTAALAIATVAGSNLLALVTVGLIVQEAFRYAVDPFSTAMANRHEESDARATVLSFMSQAYSGGEIIGGIALGALATATSITTAMLVAAVILVLSGIVITRAETAPA